MTTSPTNHCWHSLGKIVLKRGRRWKCCHCDQLFDQGPDKEAIAREKAKHGPYLPVKLANFDLVIPLPREGCRGPTVKRA